MSNEDSNHIHVHDAVVHVEDTVSTFSRIDSGIVNVKLVVPQEKCFVSS